MRSSLKIAMWLIIGLHLPLLGGIASAGQPALDNEGCPKKNAPGGHSDSYSGIVLEGVAGQEIAHDIACADRPAAFRAFAAALRGPVGKSYYWLNATRKCHGLFRTTWVFRAHGVQCRDFALDHMINGHRYLRQGTACFEADGNWHLH